MTYRPAYLGFFAILPVFGACSAEAQDGSRPRSNTSASGASAGAISSGGAVANGGVVSSGGAFASGGATASGGSTTSTGGSGTLGGAPGTGGFAGTLSSGGTGSAGAPSMGTCTATAVATGNDPLIDPIDADASLPMSDGRVGDWYFSRDTSPGTSTPAANGPATPQAFGGHDGGQAIHVSGSGFTAWGGSVSVSFGAQTGCYDAAAYGGIRLWLKGTTGQVVRVNVITADTGPTDDHYGVTVTFANSDWMELTKTWAELTRVGWSNTPGILFDAAKLRGIAVGSAGSAPISFDFWIDDVKFSD